MITTLIVDYCVLRLLYFLVVVVVLEMASMRLSNYVDQSIQE